MVLFYAENGSFNNWINKSYNWSDDMRALGMIIYGLEKIDNFIQEMQLKIDYYEDIVFEWVPYNQFSDIKEIGRGGFATVYSAIWKDGPLQYDWANTKEYTRKSNYKVALKCLHNSQNITNEFLNEV